MAGDDLSEVSDEALTDPPSRVGALMVGEFVRLEGTGCKKSTYTSNAQPEGDEAYRSFVRVGYRSICLLGMLTQHGLRIALGGADREGFGRRGDISGGWACGCRASCRNISGDFHSSGDSLSGRHVVLGCWGGALS